MILSLFERLDYRTYGRKICRRIIAMLVLCDNSRKHCSIVLLSYSMLPHFIRVMG